MASRGKIRDWGFLRNARSKRRPETLDEDARSLSTFTGVSAVIVYVLYVFLEMLSSMKCCTPNNKVCRENIVGANHSNPIELDK